MGIFELSLIILFFFFFSHARGGEILAADPASACSSLTAKNKETDQKTEDQIQVLQSEDVTCATGGANICSGNQKTSPEAEPPEEKRARRGGDEEAEEGEITDSGDEEDEGTAEGDAARGASPANRAEGIEEEAADA